MRATWDAGRSCAVFAVILGSVGLRLLGAPGSAEVLSTKATAFLQILTPEQRTAATFPFDHAERFVWYYTPVDRKGISFKEFNPAQRAAAEALLEATLSQRGYLKASQIRQLDLILREQEARATGRIPTNRDPDRYWIALFGTPSPKQTWGMRIEGHHISLNFTIVNGTLVSSTPEFFGANPAEVREGPTKGLRVLAPEEDMARQLLTSLTPDQQREAIFLPTAPNDIVTTNAAKVDPLAPAGIAAGRLTGPQKERLLALLTQYASNLPTDIGAERMTKVRNAGLDRVFFAWAGGAARGDKHYYRVQGPTFLIEYDNTQNDGNHIHTVWRDFAGDYGRDLLREHYRSAH